MKCRPRSGEDRGATAVEFAILFPVFVMLAFGTISFGFAFEKWISVTQGAREASRFAATYPMPSTGVSPWLADVKAVAKEAAGIPSGAPLSDYFVCVRFVKNIDPSVAPVTTSSSEGSLRDPSACPASSTTVLPDNAAEVMIMRAADLSWILGAATVAVSGDNISRYEPRLDPVTVPSPTATASP